MGYISKPIAQESIKPAKVSLSGVSNFLEIKALEDESVAYKKTRITLTLLKDEYQPSEVNTLTKFTITEYSDDNKKQEEAETSDDEDTQSVQADTAYTFQGTLEPSKVDDRTFWLENGDRGVTAENIRSCLLKSQFFKNNFDITIPYNWDGAGVKNGSTIVIESLGAGNLYRFTFEKEEIYQDLEGNDQKRTVMSLNPEFIELGGDIDPTLSSNNDMIDHGLNNKDIEVEVYTHTDVFLGMSDHVAGNIVPGSLLTTMTKSYFGKPVWFDINALMSSSKVYSDSFLQSGNKSADSGNTAATSAAVWADAGTVSDVRLIAKTYDGIRREPFYYSDVLYAITGYARTLDAVNMDDYIFNQAIAHTRKIKPLTNQPTLTHVKGQSQYFNFILSDPNHNADNESQSYNIGIFYEFYTQSGKLISTHRSLMQAKDSMSIINTVKLDMDEVIELVENAGEHTATVGIVKASLCNDSQVVSHPVEYCILPHCLHKVNDFAFLNALGGWSSFNFEGEKGVSLKSSAITTYQTLLPRYGTSSRIESVFDKDITEIFTVKTLPITASVADWLKELTASVAVYELSTKRYVVINDFEIKHSTKDNLFVLEMKYHYSDNYNAVIK